jgi:UDP-N-acetylmuramoyl-tripeptide--D-alanyl-D-alanine ligase
MSQIAQMLGAEFHGHDGFISGVFTDTRNPDPEGLFFALKGPRFNAHDILPDCPMDIAAGLVVERPVDHPAPQIIVSDTRLALGRLAALWRSTFKKPVIALTGSNGKTTVKEMIAAILREAGQPLVTEGNLNNDIGVPLTLLRLRDRHDFAVIELGANHPGEIYYLSQLVKPDVALITNAGPAHLEGFGDLQGVAQAKGEIFSSLSKDSVAIINADDEFSDYWRSLNTGRRILLFGKSEKADVRLLNTTTPQVVIKDKVYPLQLGLFGVHNLMNAAAAMACALAIAIPVEVMLKALAEMPPVKGRLVRMRGIKASQLIDDSYNANPGSVKAAIAVLSAESAAQKILVLGDMAELGPQASTLHEDIGRQAKAAGIDRMLCYGALASFSCDAFGEKGERFSSQESLIARLRDCLDENTAVLVKGSHSMRMDQIVSAIRDAGDQSAEGHHHAA